MTEELPLEHADKFTGPVELEGPTVQSILRGLGVSKLPEAERLAAVRRAKAAGKLFPLEVEVLIRQGWLPWPGSGIEAETR